MPPMLQVSQVLSKPHQSTSKENFIYYYLSYLPKTLPFTKGLHYW